MLIYSTYNVYAEEKTTNSEVSKFFGGQHAQSGTIPEINETAYSLELNDM
ncbi:MAG: hypothetical protein ACPKQO_11300 [Nitrososphaeraceae archaeon]